MLQENQTIESQQEDLSLPVRARKTEQLITQIHQEIEQIKATGDVAPQGAWIVHTRSTGKGGSYWYFKWQAKKYIYRTKEGKPARSSYLGKVGTPEFLESVEMQLRRSKIKVLEEALRILGVAQQDLALEFEQGTTRDNRVPPT